MGNRAIIQLTQGDEKASAAIYLHWNGGPESVYAFLEYAHEANIFHDADYGTARLCQIIGNALGGTTSLGILPQWGPEQGTHGDNGVYLYDYTTKTMRRFFGHVSTQEMTPEDVAEEHKETHEHSYWTDKGEDGINFPEMVAKQNDYFFRPEKVKAA